MNNKRTARRGAVQTLDSDSNTHAGGETGGTCDPSHFQSEGAESLHFYDVTPTF